MIYGGTTCDSCMKEDIRARDATCELRASFMIYVIYDL